MSLELHQHNANWRPECREAAKQPSPKREDALGFEDNLFTVRMEEVGAV